jgi:hypothetical protein
MYVYVFDLIHSLIIHLIDLLRESTCFLRKGRRWSGGEINHAATWDARRP